MSSSLKLAKFNALKTLMIVAALFSEESSWAKPCGLRALASSMFERPAVSAREKTRLLGISVNPKTPKLSVYQLSDDAEKSLIPTPFSESEFTYANSAAKYEKFNQEIQSSMREELTTLAFKKRDAYSGDVFVKRNASLKPLTSEKNSEVIQFMTDSGLRPWKTISMDDLVANHRHMKLEQIKKGLVNSGDVIEPSLAIRFSDGRVGSVTYGAPIPDQAEIYTDIISSRAWMQYIAEGRLVMGGNKLISGHIGNKKDPFITQVYMHELRHLVKLRNSPQYEKSVIQFSRALGDQPTAQLTAYQRYGYFQALEGLRIFHHQNRNQILKMLTFTPQPSNVTVAQTLKRYSSIDEAALRTKAEELLKQREVLIDSWGATAGDPRNGGLAAIRWSHEEPYTHALAELESSLNNLKRGSLQVPDFYRPLAKLETLLHNTRDIRADQWVDHLLGTPQFRSNSALYDALCKSSVLQPVNNDLPPGRMYNLYCTSK